MDGFHLNTVARHQPNGHPGQRQNHNARPDPSAKPDPLRPSQPSMSRAEKFEDEKRRIMSSCFSKKDEHGQLLQSYITHIRVEEDALYPSQPPPPDADPQYKKGRAIIVAVKNSGRVFMHKARENDDFTFQIGKSWPMEELKSIESFAADLPRTPEDIDRARNAGPVGFILVISKPYYWQAKTAKEKDFFLGSLVKIYRKYTSGKVPQLIGFDKRERDEMLGAVSSQQHRAPSGQQPPPNAQSAPRHEVHGPAAPLNDRHPSPFHGRPGEAPTEPYQRSTSAASSGRPRPPSPSQHRAPPPIVDRSHTPQNSSHEPSPQPPYGRNGTPQLRPRPSQDAALRTAPSREQLKPNRFQPPNVNLSPSLTPQSSYSNMSPPPPPSSELRDGRPFSPRKASDSGRMTPDQGSLGPLKSPFSEGFRRSPAPTDRTPPPSSSGERARPSMQKAPSTDPTGVPLEALSSAGSAFEGKTANGERQPPERRRPPLDDRSHFSSQMKPANDPDMPEPLGIKSKGEHRRPTIPQPTPSQLDARIPGAFTSPIPTPTSPTQSDELRRAANLSTTKETTHDPEAPRSIENNESIANKHAKADKLQNKTAEIAESPSEETQKPQFRPGLGPMMAKKTASEKWRKATNAATAATAFKPRAGGAGARLFAEKPKPSDEPDGVTSVVPAPLSARNLSEDKAKPPSFERSSQEQDGRSISPPTGRVTPQLNVSAASPITPPEAQPSFDSVVSLTKEADSQVAALDQSRAASPQPALSPEAIKKKRSSSEYNKYLSALEIEPISLDSRGLDYEMAMSDFGWSENILEAKKLDQLEFDLRREISKLEAGSWLGHDDQKDNRIRDFEEMLDNAINECDEMEGLLTLYGVELGTLTEDIAFIEAQSQGLQVQTANQKLLHTELQNLVQTVSINTQQVSALKTASFNDPSGLESIESSLLLLYRALHTIDPQALAGKGARSGATGVTGDLTGMKALQDRKGFYMSEAFSFLERVRHYLDPAFGAAFVKTTEAIHRSSGTARGAKNLDVGHHDLARSVLWHFSPLMLFAKELDPRAWSGMIKVYAGRARPIYQDEFRDSMQVWKRTARKTAGEDLDFLFTSQEKEPEGLTSTARKLTVKRSQTLARGFRSGSNEKRAALDRNQDAKLMPFESFAGALEEMVPLITSEQNFVVDFFHVSSTENVDFVDAIVNTPPEDRRGTNALARKPYEQDRKLAKLVADVMEDIFGSWPREMQSLIEWAVSSTALQGVGVLCALERKKIEISNTDQEFMSQHLQKMQERLANLFIRCVDEQIRAIEDTKVKIKKRKGVIAFMKIFPGFSAVIESMLPPADGTERLLVRQMVDDAYTRINRTMFDSLKVIAKESPVVATNQPVHGYNADPDDKEALNYHILLIENMHHYLSEVEDRGDVVLGHWRSRAAAEMAEHQGLYVSAVIRRPVGKLLDFVESTETLLLSARTNPGTIANTHPSHSRSVFKKVMGSNTTKDIRKGIDTLKARVEKHFGDADEPGISHKLLALILDDCERRYIDLMDRTKRIATDVYDGSVEVEFGKADIIQAFKR